MLTKVQFNQRAITFRPYYNPYPKKKKRNQVVYIFEIIIER
jgi:hypothetical protein